MELSAAVLAKGRGGKAEVRAIVARGVFVMCRYLDPNSMKQTEPPKRKLSLRNDDGTEQEYFIIPLKAKNRFLLIEDEKEEKERKVWNEKEKTEEPFWI